MISSNADFLQAVTEANVQLTMQMLYDRRVVLREMMDKGENGLAGTTYDVSSGRCYL